MDEDADGGSATFRMEDERQVTGAEPEDGAEQQLDDALRQQIGTEDEGNAAEPEKDKGEEEEEEDKKSSSSSSSSGEEAKEEKQKEGKKKRKRIAKEEKRKKRENKSGSSSSSTASLREEAKKLEPEEKRDDAEVEKLEQEDEEAAEEKQDEVKEMDEAGEEEQEKEVKEDEDEEGKREGEEEETKDEAEEETHKLEENDVKVEDEEHEEQLHNGDEEAKDSESKTVRSDEEPLDEDTSSELPPEASSQLREAGVAAGQRSLYYHSYKRLEQGRGHVTQEDMYTALQLLGQCPQSREQVLELLQSHGCTGERISLRDFANFGVRVCRSQAEVRADLEASFRVFDTDGSGFLDRQELRRALFGTGGLSEGNGGSEDFEELALLADTNGDGRIDCAEFCRLVTMGIQEMRLEAAKRVAAGDGGDKSTGS